MEDRVFSFGLPAWAQWALAARFSACFFRAYLTGLSRICYCFLLESILLPLGSFFLSDAAATAASCSMITLCSGGHSPALCLYSPGTSAAAPAAACPGACLCLSCRDKFMHTAWGLPGEGKRWGLKLDGWKCSKDFKALEIQMWLYVEFLFYLCGLIGT